MRVGWRVALSRAVYRWVAAFACLVLTAPLAAQTLAPPLRPANGLIVKLKDAPAHEQAQALRPATMRTVAQDERLRVQRVLAATGLNGARLRPVGRAAQHLDLGRMLSGMDATRIAEQLRQRPEVEWVVPNERERRLQVPNDPYFARGVGFVGQWWLFPVSGSNANVAIDRLRGVPGLQSAWGLQTGTPAAVVAVLDTGITSHPDLAGRILPGYDFVSTVEYANDGNGRDADASDPGDWVSQDDKNKSPELFGDCAPEVSSWHGTDIAGIVAAVTNNGNGVAGINWNGRVLPVRVAGKCGADVADIVDGMYWAAGVQLFDSQNNPLPLNANPARIVNISFGGSDPCNAAYQTAINDLATRGVVVVAAAGNEHGAVSRPASCSGVVGVAALNRDGFKTTYSNFGPTIVVSTVGGDFGGDGAWGNLLGDDGLLSVDNGGVTVPGVAQYSFLYGTSFATPVVAGVVSLMLSTNPSLTAAQMINGLRASARPHVTATQIGLCSDQNPGRCICTKTTCGEGVLDAAEAVLYALNPAGYVNPNRSGVNIDSADVIAAASLGPDLPANPTPSAASSGGGAVSAFWVFALTLAVVGLGWDSRQRRGG